MTIIEQAAEALQDMLQEVPFLVGVNASDYKIIVCVTKITDAKIPYTFRGFSIEIRKTEG